ncbi:MAG: c-type cytochrome [Armatimonadetes bacterium]|nr:c-type cytochrome [Armatimonadota bacterium]
MYSFTVPDYAPIRPPFGDRLSDDEMAALVAFLMSLE